MNQLEPDQLKCKHYCEVLIHSIVYVSWLHILLTRLQKMSCGITDDGEVRKECQVCDCSSTLHLSICNFKEISGQLPDIFVATKTFFFQSFSFVLPEPNQSMSTALTQHKTSILEIRLDVTIISISPKYVNTLKPKL